MTILLLLIIRNFKTFLFVLFLSISFVSEVHALSIAPNPLGRVPSSRFVQNDPSLHLGSLPNDPRIAKGARGSIIVNPVPGPVGVGVGGGVGVGIGAGIGIDGVAPWMSPVFNPIYRSPGWYPKSPILPYYPHTGGGWCGTSAF